MNVLRRYKVNGVAIFSDALRTALGLSLLFRTHFCLFEHVTPISSFLVGISNPKYYLCTRMIIDDGG